MLAYWTEAAAQESGQPAALLEPEALKEVVFLAADNWAGSRGCPVGPEARVALLQGWEGAKQDFATKFENDGMTVPEARTAIAETTAAYLDQVSARQFGAARSNCEIKAASLTAPSLTEAVPEAFMGAPTGYLVIDGTQKGAAIYVDEREVGHIRQEYVVSAGNHKWATMKCSEEVYIGANEKVEKYCDKE
jgi:hypothetical protein